MTGEGLTRTLLVVALLGTGSIAGLLLVSPAYSAQETFLSVGVPRVVQVGEPVNISVTLTDSAGNFVRGWLKYFVNGKEWGEGFVSGFGTSSWPGPPGMDVVTVTFNGTVSNCAPGCAYQSVEASATVDVVSAIYPTSPKCSTNGGPAQPCFCPSGTSRCFPYTYLPLASKSSLPSGCALLNGRIVDSPPDPKNPTSYLCPFQARNGYAALFSGVYLDAGDNVSISLLSTGPVSFYLFDNDTYFSNFWQKPQSVSGDLVEAKQVTSFQGSVKVPRSTGWFFLVQPVNSTSPKVELDVTWPQAAFASNQPVTTTTGPGGNTTVHLGNFRLTYYSYSIPTSGPIVLTIMVKNTGPTPIVFNGIYLDNSSMDPYRQNTCSFNGKVALEVNQTCSATFNASGNSAYPVRTEGSLHSIQFSQVGQPGNVTMSVDRIVAGMQCAVAASGGRQCSPAPVITLGTLSSSDEFIRPDWPLIALAMVAASVILGGVMLARNRSKRSVPRGQDKATTRNGKEDA